MSEIFVIGHRNPDTDAICSAIGYAEFKNRTGMPEAVPARCGDTNARIDFVLQTFGVPAPRFVADVSPKVSDVMQRQILSVAPDTVAAQALHLMDERNIRVLPVLDNKRHCYGLLSLFKLTKFLFPAADRLSDSRRILSSVKNLTQTLHGKLLVSFEPEREEELIMLIGAMSVDSFTARLKTFPREKLIIIVGDRRDIQETAIRESVRTIIATGGIKVEDSILNLALANHVSIISSPHDTATTSTLCRAAVAVRHVLNEEFICFQEHAALCSTRSKATASGHQIFPVLDSDNKVSGILSKTDFLKNISRKLILVDHNEISQAVQGADEVEIIEIIDHHRIGTLATSQPILFRNEPVGSTSTIVADCFFQSAVDLPAPIAGLLLAGIVSDTLNLTSPTATARDSEILKKLEQISNTNARAFAEKFFASDSLLTLKPASQAITTDCKEYVEDGSKFSIAQIEEIGFEQFWKRKDELIESLRVYRQRSNYLFSTLLVTDVTAQNSLLLAVGDEDFIRGISYPCVEPGIYELQDVVSRKKQLLPYLIHCLRQATG
ncbi:MAG TPA: putative manganese-dependent inorganic diphosphatase [Candidatus Acidoferrales bacterium]|jgi:manganese-dependent inorganic pyrophosphatase|nr:putative manganese-dependent inorganic diphosphatase [Candidatus Acidoferrales bacterium]